MKANDPTDTRSQEAQRARIAAEQKQAVEQAVEDFQGLMDDPRFRRFAWRLLEKTGVFRSSFTGNSETFFREGARNVGLWLMDDLHTHTPDAYVLMLKERKTK